MTRAETFGRNYAIIDNKYGPMHKEAFGEDQKISKYGYPDMGNNIYSDMLPYKDWALLNNAQRCHENFITHLPIYFSTLFVSALSYPKFTFYSAFMYFGIRVMYTN